MAAVQQDPAADQFYQYLNLARKLDNGSLLSLDRCRSSSIGVQVGHLFVIFGKNSISSFHHRS